MAHTYNLLHTCYVFHAGLYPSIQVSHPLSFLCDDRNTKPGISQALHRELLDA